MKIISKVYDFHMHEVAVVEWDSKENMVAISGISRAGIQQLLEEGIRPVEKGGKLGVKLFLKDGKKLVENLHLCIRGTYLRADFPEVIEDE